MRIAKCRDYRVERVETEVTRLLADPDIHVVAVGPASITVALATWNNTWTICGLRQPHFAATVIYQDRLPRLRRTELPSKRPSAAFVVPGLSQLPQRNHEVPDCRHGTSRSSPIFTSSWME